MAVVSLVGLTKRTLVAETTVLSVSVVSNRMNRFHIMVSMSVSTVSMKQPAHKRGFDIKCQAIHFQIVV